MKKQYVAPMADKVDFDYEENVVASGMPSKEYDCTCSWGNFGSFGGFGRYTPRTDFGKLIVKVLSIFGIRF